MRRYQVGDVLYELVERLTGVPDVAGAGVSLGEADRVRFVTGVDEAVVRVEPGPPGTGGAPPLPRQWPVRAIAGNWQADDAGDMGPDDARIETPAQWLEHSEAWRYAHLDLAPSEEFRRLAIQEHQRVLHPAPEIGSQVGWLRRLPKRSRHSG